MPSTTIDTSEEARKASVGDRVVAACRQATHLSRSAVGRLDWQYQKDTAARAVRELTGVTGVTQVEDRLAAVL